ncbi:putative pentatricopeptide repeat-containing protein At3g49142 [Impatiens glandulifera]|uniref:putative pentatricopeptide repeat-containing protein At3g49142 n=1 Tax=Impatiens glandulifera TaxID=253017 RepID=UPI001FB05754|nr:putative pentatricopeptide repeat-containing protein At3g49142 [Impatiens glandulifera]
MFFSFFFLRRKASSLLPQIFISASDFSSFSFDHLTINHHSPNLIKQTHARICLHGLHLESFFATKLISAYSACGYQDDSRAVFESVPIKNVYLWNTTITGYVKNRLYNQSFFLFNQMNISTHDSPDDFTFSILAKASSAMGDLLVAKSVHGKCIRVGYMSDTVLANSLLSMYAAIGQFMDASLVFDEMPQRNVSSWNALIAGYTSISHCNHNNYVWDCIKRMQIDGFKPNAYTASTLLPCCEHDNNKSDRGKELHCYIVKNTTGYDDHTGCCLIDMYSRTNRIKLARRIFDRLKQRNVFAWTAMVNGSVLNGEPGEAIVLFREMQFLDGIEPNRVSLLSILPAFGSQSGLMGGRQIHGYAFRRQLNHEPPLSNALIDMYSKCGSLIHARLVFDNGSFSKDTISWSTMISAYGLHGKGEEAVDLYYTMIRFGIKPDKVTIVGVLSACGRTGLVNEGLNIYKSGVNEFGIEPTMEMCACMVNMLSQSGQLDRALEFIQGMGMEPGPSVWGALLSGSVIHGNVNLQDLAIKILMKIEPENPSNYVSLSNIHASSKRWDVVANVRSVMKERKMRKLPGCSWIDVNNKTHSFYVADIAHTCSNLIYEMVGDIASGMKVIQYVPDLENS